MRDWFGFVLSNKRILNFGFLFNFFSSFGQTFFISLFVPYFIDSNRISNGAFGSVYAVVTVISAFLISAVGKYIDHIPLKKYGLIVFSGLMVSVVVLSQARNIAVLTAGLFLVRWFGQGLMTHTSTTGIAKYFDNHRGKALGVTALGHPAGQFFLPLIVVSLISLTDWRISLIIMAALATIIVIPSLWAITPVTGFEPDAVSAKTGGDSKINYFADSRFWIIAANSFLIPFICTAIFLYQYLDEHKWVFPAFYALLGISSGLGSTIKTAVQVEIYGAGKLGKIRSYFSTLLVLSTVLGPPAFGFLIDHGFSFNWIMAFLAAIVLAVFILSFRIKQNRLTF